MEFDYSLGFLKTCLRVLIFSIGLLLLPFIVGILADQIARKINPEYIPPNIEIFFKGIEKKYRLVIAILFISSLAIIFFIPTMLLIYPIVNLLLQTEVAFTSDFIKSEIQSGVLPLRMTSIILGLKSLKLIFRVLGGFFGVFKYSVVDDFIWQYAFYASTVGLLWFFAINNQESLTISLLSWAIFFILDDFSIIEDYTRLPNVIPIKNHILKIIGINIVITIMATASIYIHYGFFKSLLAFFPFFIFCWLSSGLLMIVRGKKQSDILSANKTD